MMQHWGASKERILVKFYNWCEKSEKFRWTTKKRSSEILREEYKIFSSASKNLVVPGHPTASARHCICHKNTTKEYALHKDYPIRCNDERYEIIATPINSSSL